MKNENANVKCKKFQEQEQVMKDITDKINAAKNVHEKARYAAELKQAVDQLLSRKDFKDHILECESCQLIANVRKRTADLILKVEKLAK